MANTELRRICRGKEGIGLDLEERSHDGVPKVFTSIIMGVPVAVDDLKAKIKDYIRHYIVEPNAAMGDVEPNAAMGDVEPNAAMGEVGYLYLGINTNGRPSVRDLQSTIDTVLKDILEDPSELEGIIGDIVDKRVQAGEVEDRGALMLEMAEKIEGSLRIQVHSLGGEHEIDGTFNYGDYREQNVVAILDWAGSMGLALKDCYILSQDADRVPGTRSLLTLKDGVKINKASRKKNSVISRIDDLHYTRTTGGIVQNCFARVGIQYSGYAYYTPDEGVMKGQTYCSAVRLPLMSDYEEYPSEVGTFINMDVISSIRRSPYETLYRSGHGEGRGVLNKVRSCIKNNALYNGDYRTDGEVCFMTSTLRSSFVQLTDPGHHMDNGCLDDQVPWKSREIKAGAGYAGWLRGEEVVPGFEKPIIGRRTTVTDGGLHHDVEKVEKDYDKLFHALCDRDSDRMKTTECPHGPEH